MIQTETTPNPESSERYNGVEEINSKSDFFLCNKKNEVNNTSEKKKILTDYKKNYLAIGCYYFNNFEYFERFFNENIFKKQSKKKEIYII